MSALSPHPSHEDGMAAARGGADSPTALPQSAEQPGTAASCPGSPRRVLLASTHPNGAVRSDPCHTSAARAAPRPRQPRHSLPRAGRNPPPSPAPSLPCGVATSGRQTPRCAQKPRFLPAGPATAPPAPAGERAAQGHPRLGRRACPQDSSSRHAWLH